MNLIIREMRYFGEGCLSFAGTMLILAYYFAPYVALGIFLAYLFGPK